MAIVDIGELCNCMLRFEPKIHFETIRFNGLKQACKSSTSKIIKNNFNEVLYFVVFYFYNDFKKAISFNRSVDDKFLNLFFAFSASPPCHKIASSIFFARPSCIKLV